MKFACTFTCESSGGWRAVHDGRDVGRVEAVADSRQEAIDKLKGEIRYRLEYCPCTGESYQHIDVEITTRPAQHVSRRPTSCD